MFNTFYDDMKSKDENVKKHKPPGVDPEHWRFFLRYRLSDDTQEKCRKNTENRSKQVYSHKGGSMTLARRREEEECTQGKKFSRGEIWTMTHKKSDDSYIHEDAQTVAEAIKVIESCDQSTKELFQNDSLAQVYGKEQLGRVRGMGAGPCPTQMINHGTQHTSFASHVAVEEHKREIVELKEEAAEEKKKRQSMEQIIRYLLQQQGDNLPPNIAAEINSLGTGPSSTDTQDLHGPP